MKGGGWLVLPQLCLFRTRTFNGSGLIPNRVFVDH
jgi:hypothetical protein